MRDHGYFSNLIWEIADLLRGPYRAVTGNLDVGDSAGEIPK